MRNQGEKTSTSNMNTTIVAVTRNPGHPPSSGSYKDITSSPRQPFTCSLTIPKERNLMYSIEELKDATISAIEATHQSIIRRELAGKSPETRLKIALLKTMSDMEKLLLTHARDQLRT